MKLKYILLLTFFCFYNYSYSCKCEPHNKETMVAEGLKNYDIVFYGELLKNNLFTSSCFTARCKYPQIQN